MTIKHWIESVLSNDEISSDEEMIEYFIKEGPMTRKEAEKWVRLRNYYLNNIIRE